MGAFETPVTMQAGTGHKYFSSPVSTQSESDKISRLITRKGDRIYANHSTIALLPKKPI